MFYTHLIISWSYVLCWVRDCCSKLSMSMLDVIIVVSMLDVVIVIVDIPNAAGSEAGAGADPGAGW